MYFLSGDIYEVILPNVIAMSIVGIVYFFIIFKITRKKVGLMIWLSQLLALIKKRVSSYLGDKNQE